MPLHPSTQNTTGTAQTTAGDYEHSACPNCGERSWEIRMTVYHDVNYYITFVEEEDGVVYLDDNYEGDEGERQEDPEPQDYYCSGCFYYLSSVRVTDRPIIELLKDIRENSQ